jgi:hypothetical protein
VILSTGNGGEVTRAASIMLAGVAVANKDVLTLAQLLHDAGFDDTAEVLIVALEAEQALVALTIQDREAMLRTLDDPPARLAELRGVLLAEHAGRMRDRLV